MERMRTEQQIIYKSRCFSVETEHLHNKWYRSKFGTKLDLDPELCLCYWDDGSTFATFIFCASCTRGVSCVIQACQVLPYQMRRGLYFTPSQNLHKLGKTVFAGPWKRNNSLLMTATGSDVLAGQINILLLFLYLLPFPKITSMNITTIHGVKDFLCVLSHHLTQTCSHVALWSTCVVTQLSVNAYCSRGWAQDTHTQGSSLYKLHLDEWAHGAYAHSHTHIGTKY